MLVQACGFPQHGVPSWRRLRGQWARDALGGSRESPLRHVQGQGQGNFGPEIADDKSVVMLGRIIERKEHGVNVEADPRHVELIQKGGHGGGHGQRRGGKNEAG